MAAETPVDERAPAGTHARLACLARSDEPWSVLLALEREIELELPDYTRARSLHRLLQAARARARDLGQPQPGAPLRLAVLSGATSSQLVWLLDLLLASSGLAAEIYEAPFGVWRQELLDPASAVYRFAPQVAIVAPGADAVAIPPLAADASVVQAALDAEAAAWRVLWDRLAAARVEVIQDSFVLPGLRPAGSLEAALPASPARFLARLNAALLDQIPGHVKLHDLDHVAATYGKRNWFDERFHVISRQPCALEALPAYAWSLTSLVRALRGRSRRCLVLDLDNTLWGGVVGDDGVEGLVLGQGSAQGEAFVRFQRYVRELRDRGVVLAVCSKNDAPTAQAPFREHREMLLRLEDVACFVANWSDKPSNLRQIAEKLRLGLDALVFVDDNPAERAFVRRELPAVAVPELPDDPAGFAATLDRYRYFELARFTAEDRDRGRLYQEQGARQAAAASSASDLDGFLRGLEMVATIRPLDEADTPRAAQLVNKSNQYNLTGRRLSEAELRALRIDTRYLARTLRLRDRFGDSGLVSVAIGREQGDALLLELWLMSCRVLARGVEHALLAHLRRAARTRGLKRLRGCYLPTPRNGLVCDHYQRLGFVPVEAHESDPPGATRWELVIENDAPALSFHIREED